MLIGEPKWFIGNLLQNDSLGAGISTSYWRVSTMRYVAQPKYEWSIL